MSLSTYLTFDGNCREAFEFYRSVFGGEFSVIQTFADVPPDMPVPEEIKDRIMHVSLPVGSSVLMVSDRGPGFGPPLVAGVRQFRRGRLQAGVEHAAVAADDVNLSDRSGAHDAPQTAVDPVGRPPGLLGGGGEALHERRLHDHLLAVGDRRKVKKFGPSPHATSSGH